MPNAFAYLMLMVWPLVCMAFFRRLPLERAIIWSVLGGYLLLPPMATFDLPLVPDFNKTTIPNLCALAFCIFVAKRRVPFWPANNVVRVLLVLFVGVAIPTVLTNSDPIVFHSMFATWPVSFAVGELPGLRAIDMFSVLSRQAITIIPFILGWAFLSSRAGMRELLLALAVGGLIYSVPALIEVRLSPQINTWVYGFFQHNFLQMMREGGFRPLVFLPHALWLAFFFMTAILSCVVLARSSDPGLRARFWAAAVYLGFVLVLCKSLAPMLYALTLVPVLLCSTRLQVRVAFGFAAVAVLYPLLRDYNLVPLDRILGWAEAYSPERAQSLQYRFDNEEQLLARAHEKWLFGWGGWGRNLMRDAYSGDIVTIPDGEWIIVFGSFGMVGYLSNMGLLAMPLLLLWRRMGKKEPTSHAAALALILAITLVDMLINAILTPYTWLIAGAVLGYCEEREAEPSRKQAAEKCHRPVLS